MTDAQRATFEKLAATNRTSRDIALLIGCEEEEVEEARRQKRQESRQKWNDKRRLARAARCDGGEQFLAALQGHPMPAVCQAPLGRLVMIGKSAALALLMAFSTQAHAACGTLAIVESWLLDGDNANPNGIVTLTPATGSTAPAVATNCIGGSKCRSFNGTSNGLLIPNNPAWSDVAANECIRISAYIKPTGAPPANGHDIWRNNSYPAQRLKLEISDPDAQRHIRCEVKGSTGGTMVATGGPDLYDGRWHQLICKVARDPDRLEAWVSTCSSNACLESFVLVATAYGAIGAINGGAVTVGRHPTGAGYYSGLMDTIEVRKATNP